MHPLGRETFYLLLFLSPHHLYCLNFTLFFIQHALSPRRVFQVASRNMGIVFGLVPHQLFTNCCGFRLRGAVYEEQQDRWRTLDRIWVASLAGGPDQDRLLDEEAGVRGRTGQ